MYRYMQFVNRRYDQSFETYEDLYRWSVTAIPDFWASIWAFMEIRAARGCDQVVDDPHKNARRPVGSKGPGFNFAENLLRYRDERTAIIFKGEDRPVARLSYAELYEAVARTAAALQTSGVSAGDRVVGFMPNMPQTIIAMLAAASLGATWSSCSPDFGIKGVMDRFGQIQPKVLFTANRLFLQGQANRQPGPDRRYPGAAAFPSRKWWWCPTPKTIRISTRFPRPSCGMILRRRTRGPTRFSNSCPLCIPSISCTPRAPPACPSAWCRARAAFCCTR